MSEGVKIGIKWVIGILVGVLFVWFVVLDWLLDSLFVSGVVFDGIVLDSGWCFDLFYLILYVGLLCIIYFVWVVCWVLLFSLFGKVSF